MRIIDRYTLRPVISVFISCIFIFLFLYVIIDILSHLEDILKHGVKIETLLRSYATYVPVMFVQIAPFACLLSTLYTFATLNHHNEIIAMRASGLSVFQVTKTAILLGTVVS
ncbi:MAG: LptF/LptG family permease, partial [Candidatus Omnitrophica bacterium]|nr:LptF/LptG family permease [Candidatus Omnitrophota bacterium]